MTSNTQVNDSSDMGGTLRALFVVPIYACARNTGSGQRTFHIYRALAKFCSLDVLLVSEPQFAQLEALYPGLHKEVFSEALSIHLRRTTAAGVSQGNLLTRLLGRAMNALRPARFTYEPSAESLRYLDELLSRTRYDFIVGRYLPQTSRSGVLAQSKTPVLLDVDDRADKVLESRLHAVTTPALSKLLLKWQLWQTTALVDRLLDRCDHVWLASEVDSEDVQHPSKSVLPNIPFLTDIDDRGVVDACPTKTCVFVGTFTHRVNREGVLHFVQRCWPAIRRAVPDAAFRVVGSGGWNTIQADLERYPGVKVVGAVPALADEYRNAAFAVVPLFEGSGTKIKVLESFLFGRTVVAHAHAVRGLDEFRHEDSLLMGVSDQDLAAGCVALFNDPRGAHAMALRGRDIVEQKYSFARFAEIIRGDVVKVHARVQDNTLDMSAALAGRGDAASALRGCP